MGKLYKSHNFLMLKIYSDWRDWGKLGPPLPEGVGIRGMGIGDWGRLGPPLPEGVGIRGMGIGGTRRAGGIKSIHYPLPITHYPLPIIRCITK
jgi:hypothetical protein